VSAAFGTISLNIWDLGILRISGTLKEHCPLQFLGDNVQKSEYVKSTETSTNNV